MNKDLMKKLNEGLKRENTKIIRASPDFCRFLQSTREDLAKKIDVPAQKIPNSLVTSKIQRWANLGKQLEINRKMGKVNKINIDVSKFLDKITE